MKKLTVVLPTYNEKDSIEQFIEEVLAQEEKLPGWEIHIIVADDVRTSDGTTEIVQKLASKNNRIHLLKTEPGLGVALIKGHQYALANIHSDLLAQLDADGQADVEILPRLVKTIEEGYDLAVGSRFVSGGKNLLSFSRRVFSIGSSLVSRLIMGPLSIKEFTNSARAFTPQLFEKINLARLPWREKTFIIQPAFLNEAILAGARYKEIPLVFKNRAEGYSKNKVINYTYDVITYAIDARLHKWGVDVPFFKATRRAKTIIKFALVGVSGTLVDFIFYNIIISYLGFKPATSKGISAEIAILNNFTFNNSWTFRHRKTKTTLWQKLTVFNIVSFGGLAIGVLIVKLLHTIYGDGFVTLGNIQVPFYNLYFFATVPVVMIWNFTVNHFITWRHRPED